ncbi:hypothetical protein QFZ56_008056 [Streptomyces achromogenes]|uniref:AAA+ ATPase domain-containing protein n=1 Tax=Streptomyces achromogenes TaxID=67255 RepID=A0ABU0QGP3_STRAH|nr:hypothetical protein [Streptomyces achromogenes]MDQ0689010.1 hypothetical protein [Streptomyces achromogenes]
MTNTDTPSRHLRVAPLGFLPEDGLVLDLGHGTTAVTVTRDGWKVVQADAELPEFRRTAATKLLPVPVPGGSLTELRELLNVGDEEWAKVVAWLLAALLPDITRPVLLLTGVPGSGKSVAALLLQHLVDPGSPFRRLPADEDKWIAATDAARVVGFDDVARIPDWQSDALCGAVSGGAMTKRGLGEPFPFVPRPDRAFILAGSLAPDEIRPELADRTVAVELPRLTERRPESELWKAYTEARPRILGALLDLLVAVLDKLPVVRENADRGNIPKVRMVDHGLFLVALEEARPE